MTLDHRALEDACGIRDKLTALAIELHDLALWPCVSEDWRRELAAALVTVRAMRGQIEKRIAE